MFHRLIERIALAFPRKKIFFIYTHRLDRGRFSSGLKANTEISYFCHTALKRRFPHVHFLRMEGEKPFRIKAISPEDVVIGHIGETFSKASSSTKRLIAFYPWTGHLDRLQEGRFNCLSKERELSYLQRCASIIWLTSEYNQATYLDREANFWYAFARKHPVRVVHQPIDLHQFPRTKWSYESSDFLYVGNRAHMKGVEEAELLVQRVGRKLTSYGHDKKLNNLDAHEVAKLSSQADFFIQHGMWECQCVSILEAQARGFIPLVTKETGYPYDHPYLLRYGDREYNLSRLREVLHLSCDEKKKLGDELFKKLAADAIHTNWEHLTRVLVEEVERLYSV